MLSRRYAQMCDLYSRKHAQMGIRAKCPLVSPSEK
jgi:hypothetical protein